MSLLSLSGLFSTAGSIKITCTLTGNGPSYGSIAVDEDMDATHMRGTLDANDTFQIVNGELKVTTSRGNVYALEDGKVKGAGAKLNGSLTAETKLFASQPEDMVEFSYDHNGLRTQKKVTKTDGTVETTDYTLHGKLVTHLTRGSDEMHFFYDNEKHPVMVDFNGARYSYVHNLQGDIVGIVDAGGSLVVEYKYDAWGKPVLVRTLTTAYEALAELNPFRYRGYVWDDEIQMYWLRNRYYWPKVQRFVNLDIILGNIGTVLAHSGWLYCLNKPTLYVDSDGLLSELPAGSFVHDWLGILFLGWYLFGNGIKRKLSSKVVGDYMRNAPVENHGLSEPMTLSQYTHSLLKPYAAGMEEGETRTVELVERVSLENGEGIVGYNYLHGVNMDAGGYVVSATITYSCGYINYDVTCTWNDIMDPNYQYESDQLKDEIAHLIPFANPTDYVVSITWNDRFIDYITGTSVPLHDLKG